MKTRVSSPKFTCILLQCLTSFGFVVAAPETPGKLDQDQEERPHGTYLVGTQAEDLAKRLSIVPITDCREADITWNGLVDVVNRNMKTAGFKEKFVWERSPHTISELEDMIKMGNPFGPFNKAKGKLDRKALAQLINHGSIYDLINNITRWTCATTGCYSDQIHIAVGENWPQLPNKGALYLLVFK
jgi:hypothetical protein